MAGIKVKTVSDHISNLVNTYYRIKQLSLERDKELALNHKNAERSLSIQILQLQNKCKSIIQGIKDKLYGNSIFEIKFQMDGEIHEGKLVAISKSEINDIYLMLSKLWNKEINILEIKEIHPFISNHKSMFI